MKNISNIVGQEVGDQNNIICPVTLTNLICQQEFNSIDISSIVKYKKSLNLNTTVKTQLWISCNATDIKPLPFTLLKFGSYTNVMHT